VVNVAEPDLFIPEFTLGAGLEVPVQIKLGSSVPTPTADMAVTVEGDYPIAVASNPTSTSLSYLSVTVPAGQRLSQAFVLQGSFPGTGDVLCYNNSYRSTSAATVTQTAFVFKEAAEAQPVAVANGSTGTFTVIPALSPPATPVLGPLEISGSANPVTITVKSSNPAVLSVTTPSVVLNRGDQQVLVSVKGVSAGQATLTLSGSIYDFSGAQSSIAVSVK
jgi:hypothetical protein